MNNINKIKNQFNAKICEKNLNFSYIPSDLQTESAISNK